MQCNSENKDTSLIRTSSLPLVSGLEGFHRRLVHEYLTNGSEPNSVRLCGSAQLYVTDLEVLQEMLCLRTNNILRKAVIVCLLLAQLYMHRSPCGALVKVLHIPPNQHFVNAVSRQYALCA